MCNSDNSVQSTLFVFHNAILKLWKFSTHCYVITVEYISSHSGFSRAEQSRLRFLILLRSFPSCRTIYEPKFLNSSFRTGTVSYVDCNLTSLRSISWATHKWCRNQHNLNLTPDQFPYYVILFYLHRFIPVSYTHLDVYKRQVRFLL